ncbi:hypothetical protein GH714_043879 [Hevea brasiliensis]|uniref:Uncharacterized protein n=1 Tax=Hevea brasiliensis TaxID=3981 RepID=A0A6A6K247_HEVBR|nr:hypothetical protein GH714_043879 [Hevea brasiliensis]
MMDIAAAEEEITRWKVAAEQEAAAGRAVEQEFVTQDSHVRIREKAKTQRETAAAAMAAREAAEKSLRLADMRASRLRDRVEELSHQLDEFETREDSRGRNGPRYVCWPWQWLGHDFVGLHKPEAQQQSSNEMEF